MGKTTRILIVEDLDSIRNMLRSYLTDAGYSAIFEADDGLKALELLQEQTDQGTPVEMILCDWNMPVFTGLQLVETIRTLPEHKATPFIMITSETEFSKVNDAIKAGVTNYVPKPFTREQVMEKVQRYADASAEAKKKAS